MKVNSVNKLIILILIILCLTSFFASCKKKTAEVIEIKDKKELPENARLYMESCYRTDGEYSWWIHYKGIYKVGENSYRYIVTDDYCTLD